MKIKLEKGFAKILGHVPAKSNQYRIARGRMYKSNEVKDYEQSFARQLLIFHRNDPKIKGKFKIEIVVFFRTMAADLDNSLKTTLDCLQSCEWIQNDNKCMEIFAMKFIDKENPRIEFKLIEL